MTFTDAKTLIDWVVKSDYEVNDWENRFIESVLNQGGDLSKKQGLCLTSIYEKSAGGGMYENRERL